MLHRNLVLLKILEGYPTSKKEVMSLLFWLRESITDYKFFDFVPGATGPRSFLAEHELQKFIKEGIIREENKILVLNKEFRIQNFKNQEIVSMLLPKSEEAKNIFIDHLKTAFPEFFSPLENKEVPAATVYTVGYEKKSVDSFLNHLLENGIKVIADVRLNPSSRVYGFHKKTLAQLLNKFDISYYHFPELGVPKDFRIDLVTASDYKKLFDYYDTSVFPGAEEDVDTIISLMEEVPTALLCFEADANRCHRSRIAKGIEEATSMPIKNV